MKKGVFLFIFYLISFYSYAQKADYSTLFIPDSLNQNANAVVRLNQIDITISSQRKMKIHTKRVVTALMKGVGMLLMPVKIMINRLV